MSLEKKNKVANDRGRDKWSYFSSFSHWMELFEAKAITGSCLSPSSVTELMQSIFVEWRLNLETEITSNVIFTVM